MSRPSAVVSGTRRVRRRDPLGAVELGALGVSFGTVVALAVAHLVRSAFDGGPSVVLGAALATGGAACVVAVLLRRRSWRRQGGRAVQRLGRRVWWTGRLPGDLPARFAALQDLERRERDLTRQQLPLWVAAVLWSVITALRLADRPDALGAAGAIALWIVFLVPGVLDFADRRTRSRLRRLIAALRREPVAAAHGPQSM